MTLSFSPLCPAFGREVHGLDPKHLDQGDRERLRAALREHAVLLFRGLELTPAEHVELTRAFGELELHPIKAIRLEEQPEIIVLAAGQRTGVRPGEPGAEDVIARLDWHSDTTYLEFPLRAALLYARVIPPEGGQTGWIDMAAVYDALPEETKRRIEGLELAQSLARLQQAIDAAAEADYAANASEAPRFEPVVQPLVHRHPETGRRVLDLSPAFAQSIVGMPAEESAALLRELTAFATQPRFVYMHEWRLGDLVAWDNWRTMHVATGHKRQYRRVMHRTQVRGGVRLSA